MRAGLIAAVLALTAVPANAQAPEGQWDLSVREDSGFVSATARFPGGQAIAVQCQSGELNVLVSGLPPLAARSRYVEMTAPGRPRETGFWMMDGDQAFSPTPAHTARQLGKGGALDFSIAAAPEPESPLGQYRFELPGQSVAVNRVLEACNRPTMDPRDDLPRWNQPRLFPTGLWARLPTPEYPVGARRAGLESGFAILSCIVGADGRAQDCRIERESSRGTGFGPAALSAMDDARLSLTGEQAPQAGQIIILSLRFEVS